MLNAPLVGHVQPTVELTLTVGLVIDGHALGEKAMQVSDPQSLTYRQYITPEEVADTFGASTSDYQALLDWGTSNGLVPTAHKNRFVATFSGTVANIEEALHIHLNNSLRPDGTESSAPIENRRSNSRYPWSISAGSITTSRRRGPWLGTRWRVPRNRFPKCVRARLGVNR